MTSFRRGVGARAKSAESANPFSHAARHFGSSVVKNRLAQGAAGQGLRTKKRIFDFFLAGAQGSNDPDAERRWIQGIVNMPARQPYGLLMETSRVPFSPPTRPELPDPATTPARPTGSGTKANPKISRLRRPPRRPHRLPVLQAGESEVPIRMDGGWVLLSRERTAIAYTTARGRSHSLTRERTCAVQDVSCKEVDWEEPAV